MQYRSDPAFFLGVGRVGVVGGGAEHIVLPKRSRWLVKPELLLDRCVQLTRVVFAGIDEHHQYSWGAEEEAGCGGWSSPAWLEYSYYRGGHKNDVRDS